MHMRTVYVTFILIFLFSCSYAQLIDDLGNIKYGNEWVDNNKEYFKIPVSEDGVYRITYIQLEEAGIDLDNITGKDFQLFSFGKEIALYSTTEGKFSSNDYIEFYGFKNRSKLDSFLFTNKSYLFNPEYSLFNDTAAYFLTWDKLSTNKRYTVINTNLSDNLPSPEPYYIHKEKIINHEYFNKPLRNIQNHVYKSSFDIGEGFGSMLQVKNSFVIETDNAYNSGIEPRLRIRYSTNLGIHKINFSVNGEVKKQETRNSFFCGDTYIDIDQTDIKNEMIISLEGVNNSNYKDKNSVSVIDLEYSREFNFSNKSVFNFSIEPSGEKKYIEIQNFDLEGNSFVLYDKKNNTRQVPIIEDNIVKFVLSPSESRRDLVLVNLDKNVKIVSGLAKETFIDYTLYSDKDYIIISDKSRFVDDNNKNWIEEYSDYRSSTKGGSHKTLIVDIKDIYNQFGYGINRHNIALNNFIIYIKDNFSNPEYIFIIGKGLEYNEMRTEEQLSENKGLFIVPTFGYPGSDNLVASRYKKDYPELPIGRLAAKNYLQVALYLQKIKKYESYSDYSQTIEEKEWMKKVIHLVGGTEDIIKIIDENLNKMGEIIHDNRFGANIHTYRRTSGSAQESVTKKITRDINEGASIVTFYGHSGITGTDFNINDLKNDKFPVFYSFGCYSGNIHTKNKFGQSEEFVLDSSGVIAYIGTSGTGYIYALANLGEKIYELTGELYGEGIGKIVQRAIKYTGEKSFDIGTLTLNQQFTYHGDPAVTFYKHSGPDFVIDALTIKSDSNLINSTDEYTNISFDIVNLGSSIDDSLKIKVLHELPNGADDIFYYKVPTIKSRNNISIPINVHSLDCIGENCTSIQLDPDEEIDESPLPAAENNNTLSDETGEIKYCFNVVNNKVLPVSPKEFAIISDKEIELKFSTLNFFVKKQDYSIQIDTTEIFNSPLLVSEKISSEGGIASWKPSIDFQNKTVYYWRISPDNIHWENSSFIYLENESEGWNQSHFYQYQKDQFDGTKFTNRKLDFIPKKHSIRIIGKKYTPSNRKVAFFDGDGWGNINPKIRPSICIVACGPQKWFRNKSGQDFRSIPNSNKNNIQFVYNPVVKDNRQGIKELLESIPDSMTIFLYTVLGDETQSIQPEKWAQDSISLGYNLYNVLEGYGAQKIRFMETRGTVPYVFIFKKGKGLLQEEIGENIYTTFELNQEVTINSKHGLFKSTNIGPSSDWDKLSWSEGTKNDSSEYSYLIVHKLNKDFSKDIIIDTLRNEYELDLKGINAEEFPYIKLYFYAFDRIEKDPQNINYWRVFYKGFPDAVLEKNSNSQMSQDTLKYGEDFVFNASIYNNSSIEMDSILVKYKITNNDKDLVFYKRYAPLEPYSKNDIEYSFPTKEIVGNNTFSVTINANNEQKEQNYYNNFGRKRFFVKQSNRSNEPSTENTFVYPNPFQKSITINTYFNGNNNKIKLIDTNGKTLYSTVKNHGKQIIKIDKQELKNGVYFLEINTKNRLLVYKIVKIAY